MLIQTLHRNNLSQTQEDRIWWWTDCLFEKYLLKGRHTCVVYFVITFNINGNIGLNLWLGAYSSVWCIKYILRNISPWYNVVKCKNISFYDPKFELEKRCITVIMLLREYSTGTFVCIFLHVHTWHSTCHVFQCIQGLFLLRGHIRFGFRQYHF